MVGQCGEVWREVFGEIQQRWEINSKRKDIEKCAETVIVEDISTNHEKQQGRSIKWLKRHLFH